MRFLILAIITLGFFSMPAQAHHIPEHLNDVTVKVDGLVCDFCARSVEKMFGKRAEVDKVNVNLDTHEITLDFKAGTTIPSQDISSLIVDSGYTVVEIIR